MISNKGVTVSKAAISPPTMKVKVPFSAPPMPPETGASRAFNPFSLAMPAAFIALITSTVEQSIKIASGCSSSKMEEYTSKREDPSGSMVIITSLPETVSDSNVAI